MNMTPNLLFIGTTELLLISGLALLLFGGKKLPEMMKGLGKGVQSFKKGIKEPLEEGIDENEKIPHIEHKHLFFVTNNEAAVILFSCTSCG